VTEKLPTALARRPWRSKKGRCIPVAEDLAVLQVDGEVEPKIRLAWAEKIHWVSPSAVLSPRAALAVAHRWHLGPRVGEADHRAADAWLRAVPELAAIGLVPPSLREPCAARTAAGRALRFLAREVDAGAVERAAGYYGTEVAEMIRKVVGLDPLEDCPVRAPRLPEYIQLEALPPVRLRDSEEALPADALKAVLEMLAFNDEAFRYAGLDQVGEACEIADLEQLVWSVFEAWREAGQSGQCTWPVAALGVFGREGVAHRLAKWLRRQEQARAPEAARVGLRALAGIGSEAALVQLAAIGERSRSTKLREEARQVLATVARQLGLSVDELADKAAPDLGLGPDGSVTLDYGADDPTRCFRVVFDEQLAPVIVDAEGKRLKSLPRPRAGDDPDAATRARARWEELREHGRATAEAQSARLERAMITGRRWPAAALHEHLVSHPLMGLIAARLLWRAFASGTGTDAVLFRVAEDRTLADEDDAPVRLEPGWEVSLPHPVDLDDATLARWGELFSDYELVQPFDQLGRVVFQPTDEEHAGHVLSRFEGTTIPTGRCFALDGWGWRQIKEGPHVSAFERPVGDGLLALLPVSPGFDLREVSNTPEQTLEAVQLQRRRVGTKDHPPTFGELPPLVFSELVRDLARLAG
jgi:hypothetical protein